jgi:hypothetical protein
LAYRAAASPRSASCLLANALQADYSSDSIALASYASADANLPGEAEKYPP